MKLRDRRRSRFMLYMVGVAPPLGSTYQLDKDWCRYGANKPRRAGVSMSSPAGASGIDVVGHYLFAPCPLHAYGQHSNSNGTRTTSMTGMTSILFDGFPVRENRYSEVIDELEGTRIELTDLEPTGWPRGGDIDVQLTNERHELHIAGHVIVESENKRPAWQGLAAI